MSEFKSLLAKAADGAELTREESARAFEVMMSGEATPAQMGAFVMALRVRGESVAEITGAATVLRAKMRRVAAPAEAVDVVGTGGDSSSSYNISTAAALVVAGAGVPVAKHGNRAVSSQTGATDVLGALGVRIGLEPRAVEECLTEARVGFMFAPSHHPAVKHVASVRVELGVRTIFNILGPLINPAGVRRHLIGVYSPRWIEPLAHVLRELGSSRAWIVHGDGLDEMTTAGTTAVAELAEGEVRTFEVTPEDAGLPRSSLELLRGGDAGHNAAALESVLDGDPGPYRDIVVFNAAGALVAAGRAASLAEGAAAAAESIDSGSARQCLATLVKVSNRGGPHDD